MASKLEIVMIGATGAVGGEVVKTLTGLPELSKLTLLGRRPVEDLDNKAVEQRKINIFEPSSYQDFVHEHDIAICTLGVGEPSKVSKEDFVKIDKTAVLDFARECKSAGVKHFELLGSVGSNPNSPSFYLRTKGELQEGLKALEFERLSIFQPSMILTPTNRYGISQAITLAVWPMLKPILIGPLEKFRGIPVEKLGRAIAQEYDNTGHGV